MRIALTAFVVFMGLHIGMTAIDNFKDMQEQRVIKYCQEYPTLCHQ